MTLYFRTIKKPRNSEKPYASNLDNMSFESTPSKAGKIVLKAVRHKIGADKRARDIKGERSAMVLPHNLRFEVFACM
jgi:hypothetical protein